MKTFSNLYFAKFEFAIEPKDVIILPEFKGSAFRGALGIALRNFLCKNHTEDCGCIYGQIFEPIATKEEQELLSIGKDKPRGFVIEPPMGNQRKFVKGENIKFKLILIGKMLEYIPYFIIIFEQIGKRYGLGGKVDGKRGKFNLLEVCSGNKTIYSSKTKFFTSIFEKASYTIAENYRNKSTITINFITPTRIEILGERKLLNELDDFKTFIINLYRRFFLLDAIYCSPLRKYDQSTIEAGLDKVILIHSDLSINELERLARNKVAKHTAGSEDDMYYERIKMHYDGFTGSIKFKGKLEPFLPLIYLGEYLHIGKYTTFGFGKYEIL